MIEHQFGYHPEPTPVSSTKKLFELAEGVVVRVDVIVIGDVIAVIALGGRIEREQPERRDTELLQVVKLAGQPTEVANAVCVGIGKGLDVYLINDGVPVPVRIVL